MIKQLDSHPLATCLETTFDVYNKISKLQEAFVLKNVYKAKDIIFKERASYIKENLNLKKLFDRQNEEDSEEVMDVYELRMKQKDYELKKQVYKFFDSRMKLEDMDYIDDEKLKEIKILKKKRFDRKV